MRFHSLPGSKRYADSEDEYAELLHRHLTMLAELLTRDGTGAERELLVVTASWSGGPAPTPREAELAGVLPAADHWTSIFTTTACRTRRSGRTCGYPSSAFPVRI